MGRLAGLPALVALAVLLIPGVASAHAELIGIEPLEGERLVESPSAVTLVFNEPVGLGPDGLRIIDATGEPVDEGPELVDGPVVAQPLPSLDDGWYIATWGIVSEDGHIIRSASVFGVGEVSLEARPDVPVVGSQTMSAVLRALTDGATLVAAGAWAAWWLFGARTRAVRRLALGATVVALSATVASLLAGWLDGGATWLGSPAGLATVARVILLGVGLGAAALVPTVMAAPVPRIAVVAAVATLGALVTLLGGGHAAGSPTELTLHTAGGPIELALEGSHLLAATVWLGAAPAVLLVLRDRTLPDGTAIDVVRHFSRTAAGALVLVSAAGGALAWHLSDGFAAGLTDPWAVTLGSKLLVVAVAVSLGAMGRRHLTKQPRRDRFRLLFAVDATLLLVVAALSSMLTLVSPGAGHTGHAAARSERCATAVGESVVSVIVVPAQPGENQVRVGGVPSGVQGVSLAFRQQRIAGVVLESEATEDGPAWQATAVLPIDGAWEVTVIARVDTFAEERASCTIGIGT